MIRPIVAALLLGLGVAQAQVLSDTITVFTCLPVATVEIARGAPAIVVPIGNFTEGCSSVPATLDPAAIVLTDDAGAATAAIVAGGVQITPIGEAGTTVVRYVDPTTGELGQVNIVITGAL